MRACRCRALIGWQLHLDAPYALERAGVQGEAYDSGLRVALARSAGASASAIAK